MVKLRKFVMEEWLAVWRMTSHAHYYKIPQVKLYYTNFMQINKVQQQTCQKINEDFSKKSWSCCIIQTLSRSIRHNSKLVKKSMKIFKKIMVKLNYTNFMQISKAQKQTCQKINEDFSKKSMSSCIIQTLCRSIRRNSKFFQKNHDLAVLYKLYVDR